MRIDSQASMPNIDAKMGVSRCEHTDAIIMMTRTPYERYAGRRRSNAHSFVTMRGIFGASTVDTLLLSSPNHVD